MSMRLAAAVVAKHVLHLIPNIVGDDGLVFAVVDLVLIANLAQVASQDLLCVPRSIRPNSPVEVLVVGGVPVGLTMVATHYQTLEFERQGQEAAYGRRRWLRSFFWRVRRRLARAGGHLFRTMWTRSPNRTRKSRPGS
jgi:hypothetical protein